MQNIWEEGGGGRRVLGRTAASLLLPQPLLDLVAVLGERVVPLLVRPQELRQVQVQEVEERVELRCKSGVNQV